MFHCTNCGREYTLWVGKCGTCKKYSTLEEGPAPSSLIDKDENDTTTEEKITLNVGNIYSKSSKSKKENELLKSLPQRYDYKNNSNFSLERYLFNYKPLNDIFGGGLTKGSVNYLYAEPGTGKSTLLGQILNLLEDETIKVLYYSGEENVYQIGSRLERLYGVGSPILDRIDLYFGESLDELLLLIDRDKPDIVILDSLQKVKADDKEGETGSFSQMKYVIDRFTYSLKSKGISGFVIGHITKDGSLAGNKTIEHIVDSVYIMGGEKDRTDSIRLLKCLKSRFGGVDTVVAMKMTSTGFDILDPSEAFKVFVEESGDGPGTTFGAILEGNQVFLVETQSLLSPMKFSYPQVVQNGYTKQRLDILLAILTKVTKVKGFDKNDIFVNLIGPTSWEVSRTLDLAVAMSIMGELFSQAVKGKAFNLKDYIFIGEIGLSGEIRSIPKQNDLVNKLIGLGYKEEQIITRDKFKSLVNIIENIFLKKDV